ncbi:MAG: excinuclease ABC subunit A [Epsilonproteobacteria bacterium]|nr:excinuclease ABC subunit A [Campylobacterota bacterium]
MDSSILIELIAFLVIGFRIYILSSFKVNSVLDKMFALYTLKNYSPFLGYTVLFYMEIILIAQYYILGTLDIGLLFLAVIDIFMQYKNIFISVVTRDKQMFLDTIIKTNFQTLTKDEYYHISDELNKPQPLWKLYSTELIVFVFVVWTAELH